MSNMQIDSVLSQIRAMSALVKPVQAPAINPAAGINLFFTSGCWRRPMAVALSRFELE